jgi:hypothetical protein
MEPCERDWITAGMAWVGLRRWLCGREEGERAWAWFQEQMELRFSSPSSLGYGRPPGRYITPDMERLLAVAAKEIALAPPVGSASFPE